MNGSDTTGGMAGHHGPRLATIPLGTPFLPTLAGHVLQRFGTGEALAGVRILLPSARARRALAEAFLDQVSGRALLLPRIDAIAQVDEEEELGRLLEEGGAAALPPAVAPLERRIALLKLLQAGGLSPAGADRLARDLARVVDLLAAHGISAAQLQELEASSLAAHRQKRLAVLQAIVTHWPGILAERGLLDPVDRRERLLAGLAARWAEGPPDGPVIAAGFATAPPAVARLLAVIARMEQGLVILPGLDPDLPDATWDAIGASPTHPLHGLHGLLGAIGAKPGDARRLGPAPGPRTTALLAAFRPASVAPPPRSAPPMGLSQITCAGPDSEALAIALAMRRTLEQPGKTAALVTRSRPLARRVAAALRRWGLQVDDSAGEPLSLRPPGAFLLALVQAAAERLRPVPLLAALKHPLARGGEEKERGRWLARVRELDLALRGPAPEAGLQGITRRIAQRPKAPTAWWAEEAMPLLSGLDNLFRDRGKQPLSTLVSLLAETGQAIAGERLWAGSDGRALSDFVTRLAQSSDAQRIMVAADEAPALLMGLLADIPVRPPWRQHPRLMILGPLEARLQHADLMILSDMNEGSWPAPPPVDPWLPPAARRALGLPVAETRTGLEAHDLLSGAAGEILITRARRDESGPTVRSRFLLRLDAAFGELPEDREIEAARALDGPGRTEAFPRPEPAPPAAERPRALRVTEADMLAADPFSFYARRMLGLRELDPLEQEADAAVRGTAVHKILERLVKERPNDPEILISEELDRLGGDPALLRLWQPRVRRMVQWAREELGRDATEGWVRHHAEVKLAADWHGVRIEGKADRIDCHRDGPMRIIDYKTGGIPKKRDYEAGMFRQLPLLRLLVETGARPDLTGEVAFLEYWKLTGGNSEGKRSAAPWVVARDAFEKDLAQLLDRYLHGNAPFTPKVAPVFAKHYRSFDQLARVEEWL